MRQKLVGAALLIVFALLTAIFYVLKIGAAFENSYFLSFQLIVFQSIIPFAVAYVASSSYVKSRLPQLLILGSSLLAYGVSNLIVTLGTLFVNTPDWANFIVTVHNSGLLALSATTLCAVLVAAYRHPNYADDSRNRKSPVLSVYVLVIVLVALFGLLAYMNLVPPFLVAGEFTIVRQAVLGATIAFLAISVIFLYLIYSDSKLNIVFWYTIGIAMIAIGVVSIFIEPGLGTPLSWTGRTAQYIGSAFLLVAVLSESKSPGVVDRWVEAFKRDRKQFDLLSSKMLNAFAYCQIVVRNGKPVDTVYLAVNDAFEKMTGFKRKDVIGKTITETLPGIEKDPADWIGVYGKVALTGTPVALENYIETTGRWYSVSAYCPRKGYFVSIFEDITERKKAEEALKRQATLIDLSPDAIIVRTLEGKITFWSVGAEKLYGYTKEEALGQVSHELLRTQLPLSINQIMSQVTGSGMWSGELCHKTKAKQEVIVQSRWLIEAESAGNISILESNTDITHHKQTEQKLEEYTKNLQALVDERTLKLESGALYARSLIEASLDPLVTISAEGKITDVNKATEDATGYCREELIGSDFSSYFTEPEKASVGYQKVFTEGFVKNHPLVLKHKSGKNMDVLYNASIYKSPDGKMQGVFAAARDVTERRKLEKKLQESERLAAIGATAGMVGHDIRNPLQAIVGDVYCAKEDLKSLPESEAKKNATECLDEVEANIDYINKIVQDLQDYARPLNPKLEVSDLQELVENALTRNLRSHNIKTTINIDPTARTLSTDPYYINRILYNLVTNSLQAMPDGGELNIRAERKADSVTITVQDTGVGIPKEVQNKMFTVMFTTKSKGQGFGLPVVKRMTESLGGTVTFESQEGKGTTFKIKLPDKHRQFQAT